MSDVGTTKQDGDRLRPPRDAFTGWIPSSTLRIGLVLVGVFLLLVALGQLAGIDIFGLTAEFLGTEVGRWLLVALLAIAAHGFTAERTRHLGVLKLVQNGPFTLAGPADDEVDDVAGP